jgi:sulfite exporter TauE/SafE
VLAALLVVLAVFGWSRPAGAGLDQRRALTDRYAPVVRLVAGGEGCGPGQRYVPIDVALLFGEPTVALRGPWGNDLVEIAPPAKELGRGLWGYHLDFPGNALQPGCTYLHWQRHLGAERTPMTYAHVVTDPDHPGRLALQYWFFYVFNEWNNLHEGDWEMIQLVFAASTVAEALRRSPVEVGYSQHEGAERSAWDDPKLERVDGTHPVVHPADGSHANFYGEALYLGSSAQEGVGCDDTRGPTVDVRPTVVTIPSDASAARSRYPWIAFEGRWGELHPAFFNGPEGPNLKTQWTRPIAWAEAGRSRSYTVPGATVFGPGATGFFCGAVGHGSRSLVQLVANPVAFSLVLGGLVLVAIFLLTRTAWRPSAPLGLARRRTWGQTLAASARMYITRSPLFVGLGVLFVPIGLLVSFFQSLLLHATNVLGVEEGNGSSGIVAFVALALGTTLTLLGLGLVQAATAKALIELDAGRPVGPLQAYRLSLARATRLSKALLLAVIVVSLFASSLYLLPVAIWLAGRWALVIPVVELEDRGAFAALARSRRLTRRRWLKVASLVVAGAGLVLVLGPLIGALLILATSAPLWLVNVVAGAIYAVTMPFVALTTAYVYFDCRVRDECQAEETGDPLPAEIVLSD